MLLKSNKRVIIIYSDIDIKQDNTRNKETIKKAIIYYY